MPKIERKLMASGGRAQIIDEAIEAYFEGLRSGAVEAIPFDRNVQFGGVLLEEPILGDQALRGFLAGMAENTQSIVIRQKVLDGDNACVIFTWRSTSGIEIDMCDQFHFKRGRIVYIRPFFDPRPLFRE